MTQTSRSNWGIPAEPHEGRKTKDASALQFSLRLLLHQFCKLAPPVLLPEILLWQEGSTVLKEISPKDADGIRGMPD